MGCLYGCSQQEENSQQVARARTDQTGKSNICQLLLLSILFLFQDYQFIFISPQGAVDMASDITEQGRVSRVEVKKH